MKNLMVLDIQGMNRLLLFMTPFIFLTSITAGHSYQFIVFVFAVSAYYVMISNMPDKQNPDRSLLIHTLPITRTQMVVAKYIEGLMWFLIAVTVYIVIAGGFGGFIIAPVPKWKDVIIVLSMLLFVMSVFYPLYYRWGYYVAIASAGPIILVLFTSSVFYQSLLPKLFDHWLATPSFLYTLFSLAIVTCIMSMFSSIRLFEANR
ncbi:ABC-2 transporter permease [Bacillus sp. FJAT-52991]|uniref:ABC-2 transporter permease n=1 Tax=Bacillus kandeliae TaxID=3129297 RepID=A0ABZ2N545_9BACI